jgi:hypothetical protein
MPDPKQPSGLARSVAAKKRKVTLPRIKWLDRPDTEPDIPRKPPAPSVTKRLYALKDEEGRR